MKETENISTEKNVIVKDIIKQLIDKNLYKIKDEYPEIKFFIHDEEIGFFADDFNLNINSFLNLVGFKDDSTFIFEPCFNGSEINPLINIDLFSDTLISKKIINEIIEFLNEELSIPLKSETINEIKNIMLDIRKNDFDLKNISGITRQILYRFNIPIDTGIEYNNSFGSGYNLTGHVIGFNDKDELLISQGRADWLASDYFSKALDKTEYKTLEKIKKILISCDESK